MKKLFSQLKKNSQYLIIGIVTILLVLAAFFYAKRTNRIAIDNSLVQAPIISITASTPGTLKNIYVANGQTVKKGDALAAVGSTIIYAYTSGIIVSTNNQIGTNASAQTNLVQMINTTNMRIDGTLDENKGLDKIKVGQVASFTIDAIPEKIFWGYVDEVSSTAKQTQAAFSISSERPTQQFEVFVRYDAQKYPEIKNGMSAKMTVYTQD